MPPPEAALVGGDGPDSHAAEQDLRARVSSSFRWRAAGWFVSLSGTRECAPMEGCARRRSHGLETESRMRVVRFDSEALADKS